MDGLARFLTLSSAAYISLTTRHCQECSSRDMQQVGKQQKAYYFTIYIDLYSRQLSRTFHSPTMYYPKVVEAPWQQATDYISSSTWVIYQCGWAGGYLFMASHCSAKSIASKYGQKPQIKKGAAAARRGLSHQVGVY